MATIYWCSICRDTVPPHHQRTIDLKCCTNHFHCSRQVQLCHICLLDLWEKFAQTGLSTSVQSNEQQEISPTKCDKFQVWCYHFLVCNRLLSSQQTSATPIIGAAQQANQCPETAVRLTTQVSPSVLLRANNDITQRPEH